MFQGTEAISAWFICCFSFLYPGAHRDACPARSSLQSPVSHRRCPYPKRRADLWCFAGIVAVDDEDSAGSGRQVLTKHIHICDGRVNSLLFQGASCRLNRFSSELATGKGNIGPFFSYVMLLSPELTRLNFESCHEFAGLSLSLIPMPRVDLHFRLLIRPGEA